MSESDPSYRYRVGANNLQSASDEPLISFNGVNFLPGPSDSVVLHKDQNDVRMMVESGLAQALRECGHFRSLGDHANAVMQAIPALRETPADVSSVLNAVLEAGLFETSEEALSRLTWPDAAGSRGLAPSRLFILTCDRPAALSRLLQSLIRQPFPDDIEGVWVVDDSRDTSNIEENNSLIAQANAACNVSIQHFDMARRQTLMDGLLSELPDNVNEIQFLLERSLWGSQPTYGLSRNLIMLLSVGKRALVLDDDILTEAIMPPLSTSSLTIGNPNDRQAVFYPDWEELNRHALPCQSSPLSMMLDHLGLPLSSVLSSELKGPRALSGWDGQAMSRLDSDSRVLIAQCGSWGDPGTGSGNWIFNLDAKSIRSALESGSNLEASLGQRASWFGYRGPVLTPYGTMSQLTGIDNSALLPPYLPVGRGEDIFFGVLTLRMHPTSVVYNEGWAIRHEPIDNRSNRGVLTPISSKLSMSNLVDWLGREPADQWGLSAERRLYGIAEQIARLSEMQQEPLLKLITHEKLSSASAQLEQCLKQAEQAGSLSELAGYTDWERFLEASRNQLLEQIQTSEAEPLKVFDDAYGGLPALQKQGTLFAAALRAWPSIRQAAERLVASD